jgi:predicted nucleic acid-binding protein
VLVDTSVWSLALRKGGPADHPAVRKLNAFLVGDEDLFLSGLILQEILQAFREDATFRRLITYFEPFSLLPLGRRSYIAAAELHRNCRSKGISVTTADCQIATAAVENDCLLLTADKDFEHIARHSGLKLA